MFHPAKYNDAYKNNKKRNIPAMKKRPFLKQFFCTAFNVIILMLVTFICLQNAAVAADAPEKELDVGYFTLWSDATKTAATGFINSMDAWPGLSARLFNSGTDSWRSVPSDVEPGSWLSLVGIHPKDGRQYDFLVFAFLDRHGTVRYAGRRQSRVPMQPPRYWFTVSPGPNQIPINAIREAASDYLYRESTLSASDRPGLRLLIKPWIKEERRAGKGSDELALTAMPSDVAEALCFAAAFEAGWRPTAEGDANNELTISMAEDANVFISIKAEGKRGFSRHHIPREALYNHLVALFRRCRTPECIMDTCAYAGHDTSLLGWAEPVLIINTEQGVKAVNPATGRTSWQIEQSKDGPTVVVSSLPDGSPVILRTDKQLQRITPENGKTVALAPAGAGADCGASLALAADARLAVVKEKKLLVFKDGMPEWSWDGEIDARPAWLDNLIVVAGSGGNVHALNPSATKEEWQQTLPASMNLRLFTPGAMLLVDTGAILAALDPATGDVRWNVETGDVLTSAPALVGGNVFVAVKPNRLLLLDAATGAIKAERSWPTWLLAVAAAPAGKVACVDLRHGFSLLDAATLKTVWTQPLPNDLQPVLLHATSMPTSWSLARSEQSEGVVEDFLSDLATTDVMAESKPAWLALDNAGFIYAMPNE